MKAQRVSGSTTPRFRVGRKTVAVVAIVALFAAFSGTVASDAHAANGYIYTLADGTRADLNLVCKTGMGGNMGLWTQIYVETWATARMELRFQLAWKSNKIGSIYGNNWNYSPVSNWLSFYAGSSAWGFTDVTKGESFSWRIYVQFRTYGSRVQTGWFIADAFDYDVLLNRVVYRGSACSGI